MITSAQIKQNFSVAPSVENQWCSGCGNFPILQTLKKVLQERDIAPQNVTLVSGVGQAAKLPQYVKCNFFNGLHGRALPVATGIKIANPDQTVIVSSGDGDVYGEGGNHLIHAIRRNPNITVIVHDNMIYGLTLGQASPTTTEKTVSPVQPYGVINEPINPLALAISLDAPFVARAYAGNPQHMESIISQAIAHKGFSLVDVLQPCVVFNKINTYQWFNDHSYVLETSHDLADRAEAFRCAIQVDKFPLGIIYKHDRRRVYEETIGSYAKDHKPLYMRKTSCAIRTALMLAQK